MAVTLTPEQEKHLDQMIKKDAISADLPREQQREAYLALATLRQQEKAARETAYTAWGVDEKGVMTYESKSAEASKAPDAAPLEKGASDAMELGVNTVSLTNWGKVTGNVMAGSLETAAWTRSGWASALTSVAGKGSLQTLSRFGGPVVASVFTVWEDGANWNNARKSGDDKQMLKSSWSAAGTLGGMAAGAAIGSIIPVAGTAVGAVVGGICAALGAWGGKVLTKKATDHYIGETDTERGQKEANLEAYRQAHPSKPVVVKGAMAQLLAAQEMRTQRAQEQATAAGVSLEATEATPATAAPATPAAKPRSPLGF